MEGVCELVKAIDVKPILKLLPSLEFTAVNIASRNPEKSPCLVVLGELPSAVHEFVAGLELGGQTRRVLFRKLAPHQGMALHVDRWMNAESDWRRFQIPLVTHPDIVMRWPEDGVTQHLEPGFLWEVRFDRPHEVINLTDHERVHIQIDQEGATI